MLILIEFNIRMKDQKNKEIKSCDRFFASEFTKLNLHENHFT